MTIFITGGTGYIGSRLIKNLISRNHEVIALVRKGSENKIPGGVKTVIADPFDAASFRDHIPKGAVFIQLLGVAHPSPRKKQFFYEIDLKSLKASADAASYADVSHFIYMSVAMSSSKIMKEYQEVRKLGESYCIEKNLNCSFIRPWYVLGPGHWWPLLLLPFYGIAELIPSWRKKAREKSLVWIGQILQTLVVVIESETPRVVEIYDIKRLKIDKLIRL